MTHLGGFSPMPDGIANILGGLGIGMGPDMPNLDLSLHMVPPWRRAMNAESSPTSGSGGVSVENLSVCELLDLPDLFDKYKDEDSELLARLSGVATLKELVKRMVRADGAYKPCCTLENVDKHMFHSCKILSNPQGRMMDRILSNDGPVEHLLSLTLDSQKAMDPRVSYYTAYTLKKWFSAAPEKFADAVRTNATTFTNRFLNHMADWAVVQLLLFMVSVHDLADESLEMRVGQNTLATALVEGGLVSGLVRRMNTRDLSKASMSGKLEPEDEVFYRHAMDIIETLGSPQCAHCRYDFEMELCSRARVDAFFEECTGSPYRSMLCIKYLMYLCSKKDAGDMPSLGPLLRSLFSSLNDVTNRSVSTTRGLAILDTFCMILGNRHCATKFQDIIVEQIVATKLFSKLVAFWSASAHPDMVQNSIVKLFQLAMRFGSVALFRTLVAETDFLAFVMEAATAPAEPSTPRVLSGARGQCVVLANEAAQVPALPLVLRGPKAALLERWEAFLSGPLAEINALHKRRDKSLPVGAQAQTFTKPGVILL